MVVGIDMIEVKDPETAETVEYRSPVYYLWLRPIKRSLGYAETPPRAEAPGKSSPQRPGEAAAKRPGLPTAPPTRLLAPAPVQPPGPAPVLPPAQPAAPQPAGSAK